jgi:hypothetical protein
MKLLLLTTVTFALAGCVVRRSSRRRLFMVQALPSSWKVITTRDAIGSTAIATGAELAFHGTWNRTSMIPASKS